MNVSNFLAIVSVLISVSCKKPDNRSKTKTLEELVGLEYGTKQCGEGLYELWSPLNSQFEKYVTIEDGLLQKDRSGEIKSEVKKMASRLPTVIQKGVFENFQLRITRIDGKSNCKSTLKNKPNIGCINDNLIVIDSGNSNVDAAKRNVNQSLVRLISYVMSNNLATNPKLSDQFQKKINMKSLLDSFDKDLRKQGKEMCKIFPELVSCGDNGGAARRASNLANTSDGNIYTLSRIVFAEAMDNWFCSEKTLESFNRNFPETFKSFKTVGCFMSGPKVNECKNQPVEDSSANSSGKSSFMLEGDTQGSSFMSNFNPWSWASSAGNYIGNRYPETFGGQTATRTLPPPPSSNYIPAIGGSAGVGAPPSNYQIEQQVLNTQPAQLANGQKVEVVTNKPEVVLNGGGAQSTAEAQARTDKMFDQNYWDRNTVDTTNFNSWESAITASKATMIGEGQSASGEQVNVFYDQTQKGIGDDPYVSMYSGYSSGDYFVNKQESDKNAPTGTYTNADGSVTAKADQNFGGFRHYDNKGTEMFTPGGCPIGYYLASDNYCYPSSYAQQQGGASYTGSSGSGAGSGGCPAGYVLNGGWCYPSGTNSAVSRCPAGYQLRGEWCYPSGQ